MRICKMCNMEIKEYEDGKVLNSYGRMFCTDCVPKNVYHTMSAKQACEFGYNYNTHKICNKCGIIKEKNEENFSFSKNNAPNSYCKICVNTMVIARTRAMKEKCIEYKGGCCQKCGYDKCSNALDFHHLDPSQKDFNISGNMGKNFDKIKLELDKCILVCANCHREIHGAEYKKDIEDRLSFFNNSAKLNYSLPDDNTFAELSKTMKPLEIADKYNVSIGAVYRKIRKLKQG